MAIRLRYIAHLKLVILVNGDRQTIISEISIWITESVRCISSLRLPMKAYLLTLTEVLMHLSEKCQSIFLMTLKG